MARHTSNHLNSTGRAIILDGDDMRTTARAQDFLEIAEDSRCRMYLSELFVAQTTHIYLKLQRLLTGSKLHCLVWNPDRKTSAALEQLERVLPFTVPEPQSYPVPVSRLVKVEHHALSHYSGGTPSLEACRQLSHKSSTGSDFGILRHTTTGPYYTATMLLLDIPPEVFARIVAHLVAGAGISEAWTHRKVCRTFRRAIEFETLANQPTRAFLRRGNTSAKNILRKNMALYLSYRIMAEKDAYSFLPRFMNRVLDVACSGLPGDPHQVRRQHARTLCKLIVKKKPDEVERMLTTKNPETTARCNYFISWFKEGEVSTHLTAATVALGNLEALRTTLGTDADRIWEKSRIFGYPLVAASAGGHVELVRAVVKHFERTKHRAHMAMRQSAFSDAISKAFEHKHPNIAFLLLQIYHAYASPVTPGLFMSWMESALRTRDLALILHVRSLRQADGDPSQEFERACSDNDLKAVRMFIEEGLLPLHCHSSWWPGYTPIRIAVASRSVKAVELVLQLGAEPDGEHADWSLTQPLWMAIQNNDVDIVSLLLEFGANPAHVMKIWEKQSREFCDDRAEIESELFDAGRRSKFFVRPTTPRTNFAADAQDLVLPDEDEETGSEEKSGSEDAK